ncbi:small-conductance mechanosensitive ion channel [Spirochaetia bacterium]|nr:small-conductance mechanosensitive ion channel [Spirochaetia bacterium]
MGNFLDFGFLGNSCRQWLLAAAFVAGGFIMGKLCSLIMSGILKRLSKRTKQRLDDIIVEALENALTVLIFLGGIALGIQRLTLNEAVQLWTGRILGIFFIVVIAGAFSRLLKGMIGQYVPSQSSGLIGGRETELRPVLRNFSDIIIWTLAGALILKTLGHNISALMAGLGLGGAAIALASKDTLANFFGSITVFVDRPFRFNERIKIAGFDGYITEMGLRTSRLRTLENRTVIIPNSIFAANPIENVSSEPDTKVSQTITIRMDNGSAKIAQGVALLKEIAVEGTAGTPSAGLTAIGGVLGQISFVYSVAKTADYLGTVNRVNLEALRRFEEAGIVLG